MIVDDAALMRRNLSTIITKFTDHTVVAEAVNGREAVSKYREFMPDLVTMDITMPVMDGIGALQAIRREFPKAKIIMVSALSQKHMVMRALQFGARNYITKPINKAKVIDVITKVLGRQAAVRSELVANKKQKHAAPERPAAPSRPKTDTERPTQEKLPPESVDENVPASPQPAPTVTGAAAQTRVRTSIAVDPAPPPSRHTETAEAREYGNLEQWIDTVEDEDDREIIELWARKVSKGRMEEVDFTRKIRMIL